MIFCYIVLYRIVFPLAPARSLARPSLADHPSTPACRPTADRPAWMLNRQIDILYRKSKCWMLNVEFEGWNVECWRLKHNISTFQHREKHQHFNVVNISTSWKRQHFNIVNICCFCIVQQHSKLKTKRIVDKVVNICRTYTTLDVENLTMLKCWKC